MRFFPSAVAAAVFLILSSGALAQTPAVGSTPIPASAKPDFSKMFPGTWRCNTKSSRRRLPLRWLQRTRHSPDGYWLVTQSTIAKTPVNAELSATDKITYDPSMKRWVDIETDEHGGYDVSTSPGWHGNAIVWTSVFAPKSGGIAWTSPTTVTRLSATRYTAVNTIVEPGGRVITVKDICTKI